MHPSSYYQAVKEWERLCNQAMRHRLAGQFAMALDLLQQALDCVRGRVPASQLLQATTLEGMAYLHEMQGNDAEAVRSFESALAAVGSLGGGLSRVERATTLISFARHKFRKGRLAEAEELCCEALDIYEKYLGKSHAFTAIAKAFQARILSARGQHEKALALIEHALPVLEAYSGDPLQAVAAHQVRAWILHRNGQTAKAVSVLTRLADTLEVTSAIDTAALEVFLDIRKDLCEILLEAGEASQAYELAWASLSQLERTFPPTAPIVETARNLVAHAAERMGRREEQALMHAVSEEEGLEKLNLANRRWQHIFVRSFSG